MTEYTDSVGSKLHSSHWQGRESATLWRTNPALRCRLEQYPAI